MEKYYEHCNLAKFGIKNPKMGEKILEKMPDSKACQACPVTEECKKVIKSKINEILNQK